MIERFQELMGDTAKHEDVAQGKDDTNKDVGAMIAEIRPTLLSASEAASELSPSRAVCLGWLLDNMHLLDANKLYVLERGHVCIARDRNQPTWPRWVNGKIPGIERW
jgi:hypothetical protein